MPGDKGPLETHRISDGKLVGEIERAEEVLAHRQVGCIMVRKAEDAGCHVFGGGKIFHRMGHALGMDMANIVEGARKYRPRRKCAGLGTGRTDVNRREFIKALGGCGLLVSMPRQGRAAKTGNRRPNVIVILADDLGCGDTSLYDGWIKTPRIDRMAREGVRFTDFHSNSSVCSPTRIAFLTGRYQQRAGIVDVIVGRRDKDGLEPTEVTLPGLMKKAGYKTALFGKWHCGTSLRHNPTKHGFDEFVGFLTGGCDYNNHPDWMDGTNVKAQKGYSTHIITDKSVDFIERNKDNPFFLYVSHQAVHNYYQIPSDPPGMRGRDVPLHGEQACARYKIMLQELDKGVGKILDTLRECGLEENTFVFFFSDNGAVRLGTNPRPFRGGKFSNYEGGHRVPAVARWPGRIKAGWTSDALVASMDLLPTIMDIVGVDISKECKCDGMSIKAHLLNQAKVPARRVFFGYEPKLGTALRDGHWKMQTKGNVVELYDLSKDIKETTNVAARYPKRTAEMKAAIEQWKREVTPARASRR